MNRNRLIVGVVAFFLVVLIVAGAWWLVRAINRPRLAEAKMLVVRLGYCGAGEIRPCITSFSQDGRGKMLIEILIPSSGFPNFYLTISKDGQEHIYDCKKVKGSSTRVQCIGRELQPGEAMQFTIIAVTDNSVLAEGNFPIIGLLLVAPGVEILVGVPLTEAPTPFLSLRPTPVLTPPTPVATLPAYPNPSYPNPTSYPNPSYQNP